mmetsp:Transcript_23795/g.52382  ORF Transcript_23795/g.52382 Transcript_23795/m.52382 type:complete len:188 (-) Transcript_23795:677-1240(-)|eukprot:CAMPEP_0204254874 /NCGR_PEP_ID=MMETSP0468-20130131/2839_1 /ASSEMBLY_ACC=CAM_ASM_000383 /TAXON_ID=2969 /ORGANISM="Oxyrrhis marina" /LENGTH=187 /DNA_ID=CAMNT_0051228679 /DNA_START=24 /DNA_END=587 /DNA_ORIENTATION=-
MAVVYGRTFLSVELKEPAYRRAQSEGPTERTPIVVQHLTKMWALETPTLDAASTCSQRSCDDTTSSESRVDPALTTLMLRNIPNAVRNDELMKFLDNLGFAGGYDAIYMPRDRRSGCCRGYVFINFVSLAMFQQGIQVLGGRKFPNRTSSKITSVGVAEIQGYQALVNMNKDRMHQLVLPPAGPRRA